MSVNPKVLDLPTDSGFSDDDLVKNIVAKLKKQGQLSGETVGRIFRAVSDNLNNHSSNSEGRKVTAAILSDCPFSQDAVQIRQGICYWLKNVLPSGLLVEAPSVAAAGYDSHSEDSSNQHFSGGPQGRQRTECYRPERKRAQLLCCGNVTNPHLHSIYFLRFET